tara:strand:+ start:7841 stop:8521 length:681 start_codon:yes stop_codon:yes gene_type:complete
MKLQWDYPIHRSHKTKVYDENQTVSQSVPKALVRAVAFIDISKDDRRPLLILRECKLCNGTDDALLSSYESNEDILMMAKWFHCVKLPQTILDKTHPFHNLFNEEHPPHLFVSKWDGTEHIPLMGDLSRSELTDNLYTMLEMTYSKKAKPRVKQLKKLLYQYDMLDEKIQRLEITIDDELEKRGAKSKKLKKYNNQLSTAKKEMVSLKEKEAKLYEIGLISKVTKG